MSLTMLASSRICSAPMDTRSSAYNGELTSRRLFSPSRQRPSWVDLIWANQWFRVT